MNVTKSTVTKIRITDVKNLDPVNVFIEDYKAGQGKMTIEVYGEAWSYYWGAMGENNDMRKFFLNCDNDYLIKKFSSGIYSMETDNSSEALQAHCRKAILRKRWEGDLGKDSARELWDRTESIEHDSVELNADILCDCIGDEWWDDLPQRSNHKYEYLVRIMNAVREALKMEEEEELVSVCEWSRDGYTGPTGTLGPRGLE